MTSPRWARATAAATLRVRPFGETTIVSAAPAASVVRPKNRAVSIDQCPAADGDATSDLLPGWSTAVVFLICFTNRRCSAPCGMAMYHAATPSRNATSAIQAPAAGHDEAEKLSSCFVPMIGG